MFSSLSAVALVALLMQCASSSPLTTPPPSLSPTPAPTPDCTITILQFPPIETNCTFYPTTTTSTVFTDCQGCALETEVLGLGLPCRAVTTVPGIATKTVTACNSA